MKPSAILLTVLLVGILGQGCVSNSVVINSATDMSEIDKTKGRFIQGQAAGMQFFLFFPLGSNTRQERAYQDLLEKAGRDVITDVQIRENWTYAFVGITYTTIFEAMAYPRLNNK
jgi:hypothetical protein